MLLFQASDKVLSPQAFRLQTKCFHRGKWFQASASMPPQNKTAAHLTAAELTDIRLWCTTTPSARPVDLWNMHKKDRRSRLAKPLCLAVFRNALRGRTYNRVAETRQNPTWAQNAALAPNP